MCVRECIENFLKSKNATLVVVVVAATAVMAMMVVEWAKTSELDDSRILPCESGRILLCFAFLDFDVYRL